MNGTMGEGVKALKKRVKKKYEIDPKTELHLIYTVGDDGQKMGAPRVEFHRREPMVELHNGDKGDGINGLTNGFNGLEVMGGAVPRSPSPRPTSPVRPVSPPKSPQFQRTRSTAPFAPRYPDQVPGRRAASAVLTGAVTPVDFSDTQYIPLQGVKATDYQMDYQVPLPSIRPMDGPPLNYGEPSYSTRYMPMDNGPPPQDYYQSWVHNARPPSTDRRVNMSYPDPAPRYHHGRLGSTWRHVRQCIGNAGNHIVFIDGTVKSEDVQRFPPWGFRTEKQDVYNQPTYYSTMTGLPKKMAYPGMYDNQFHDRAKKGFKYWQEQKRPHSPMPKAKQTIQGRAMKYGIGM